MVNAEVALWILFFFVLGAAVGSFLNVCVYRLPHPDASKRSVVLPPSHCPRCEHSLRIWPDMVPLFSQLFYRSRCRYCGERFSWRYFWVEVLTGLLFVAVGLRDLTSPWELVPDLVFVSALVAIAFIDFENFVIPDPLVWVAVGAGVAKDLCLIAQGARPLWYDVPGTAVSLPVPASIWGAALSGWLLWQLAAVASAAVKQEAMGGGDTMLLVAMGANLTFAQVGIAFVVAVGFGAVAGVIHIALLEWRAGRPTAALAPTPPEGSEAPALPGGGVPLDPEPVLLPLDSRLGRILTVLGSWVLVGGLWWVAARWGEHQRSIAVSGGLLVLTVAAALLRGGLHLWKRGDAVWAPEADAAFEEGPGPRMIPFGPCLVFGSLIALFFGDQLVQSYSNWLGLAAGTG